LLVMQTKQMIYGGYVGYVGFLRFEALNLSLELTPHASGSLSESLILTDNALNVKAGTQSIGVSGTGMAPLATLTSPTPGSVLGITSVTFSWTEFTCISFSLVLNSPATNLYLAFRSCELGIHCLIGSHSCPASSRLGQVAPEPGFLPSFPDSFTLA
jgi:hypothetical protein